MGGEDLRKYLELSGAASTYAHFGCASMLSRKFLHTVFHGVKIE